MGHASAIFAWGRDACKAYHVHCRDLYLPEHSCTAAEIRHMNKINVTDWPTLIVPRLLTMHLPGSFTKAQINYWWHAQALAYLMRLNRSTAKRIREMRQHLHGHLSMDGIINVNIRSGDKRGESRLSPTELIVNQAETLIVTLPLSFSRVLFVTSDNLDEIKKAKLFAQQKGLHVIYSNIPRMKHGHDQASVKSFWTFNTTIVVLMELFMAAECDAWIGTRSSNWNRLIDHLRCTHAKKCKQAFVEAGDTMYGHYDRPPGYWV
jgi:hypothetical protein